MVMAKNKRTHPAGTPIPRANGHDVATSPRSTARRPRRNPLAHSPVRYVPWLVLTGALHAWLFVFPLPEGDDRQGIVEEKRRQLLANVMQLEAIQKQMETADVSSQVPQAPPEEIQETPPEDAQEKTEEARETQNEQDTTPPAHEETETNPVEERPTETSPAETQDPLEHEEEMPDRTTRKAIEGAESTETSTEPEGTAGEEQPESSDVGEESTTSDTSPASATDLARRELQAILDEPLSREGHFKVAYGKWEAQAARKLGETSSGAAGEEDGMPQVELQDVANARQFLSALELFGGEVFLQNDSKTWWHLAREGERFEPRFVTREQVLEIARRSKLNISFAKMLVPGSLPDALEEARRRAVADERWVATTEARSFICMGTTREQSFVSEKAQTFLRRNRSRFPQYSYWEDAKVIQYRYLADANDVVYDVEVTNLK